MGLHLCLSNKFPGAADLLLCRPKVSIKEFNSSSHRLSGRLLKTVKGYEKREVWVLGWSRQFWNFYVTK